MDRTLTINEIKERALDDILQEVARSYDTLTVVMADGGAVQIGPGH
jgi:hypothetical protein